MTGHAPSGSGWSMPSPISLVAPLRPDPQSTRLNSRHTEIYTLSLHDALPISVRVIRNRRGGDDGPRAFRQRLVHALPHQPGRPLAARSAEHTSELQAHRDLHSFPTRRSSDLGAGNTESARRR